MHSQYSLRSPAVKRLMREAQELSEPTETYHAHPLEDNLFEWHFTIRGPEDTEFEGGLYHGRIILPPDYPMKPPSIILLTPNGRFEVHKKICLSISGHHPESWQPSWSIRTALLAIIGFMPTHGNGAIGSLDYTPDERKILARRTLEFKCSTCGPVNTILKPVTEASKQNNKEAKELAQQISFQAEKEKKVSSENTPPVIGESNIEGAGAAAPVIADAFPGLPGAGAFPMIPPFLNPMFSPPTTTAEDAQNPHAVHPHMFLPPFWGHPNMPHPATEPAHTGHSAVPPHAFWPPGFNTFPHHQQPAPTAETVNTSTTDETTTLTTTSSPRSDNSANTNSSTATPNSSSSLAAAASNEQQQTLTNTATTNTHTTSENPAVNTSSPPASTTGLRQRSNVPVNRHNAPPHSHVMQEAELPRNMQEETGGWFTFGLMLVIGLILLLLIVRRLAMMGIIDFKVSF